MKNNGWQNTTLKTKYWETGTTLKRGGNSGALITGTTLKRGGNSGAL
jgi:hypothetical protein